MAEQQHITFMVIAMVSTMHSSTVCSMTMTGSLSLAAPKLKHTQNDCRCLWLVMIIDFALRRCSCSRTRMPRQRQLL